MNRSTKLFQPINVIPKNATIKNHKITSKSQKLMLDLGIIHQANPGCYHFLPLGLRALNNLIRLVDVELKKINCQKIEMPTLINSKLWEKSGRINSADSEVFKLRDRHNHPYLLGPTHEEAVTDLLAGVAPLSYKCLPLRLYQITSKFRDEMKSRFGIMRGRQFIMKDLYTFDIDAEKAKETYETVCDTYDKIFRVIEIPVTRVVGATGNMGGTHSHEYHYCTDVGEDHVFSCTQCSYIANTEVCGKDKCPKCENVSCTILNGIEVAHTFLLGEKYSRPLGATYLSSEGKPIALQMGCYGLGMSRILAASIEVLSSDNEIRWPYVLAPFKAIIIPPKAGSKEESPSTVKLTENLYNKIDSLPNFSDDVLIDDRVNYTIGKRYHEAKRVGYPYIIVIGNKAIQDPPYFEINNLCDNSTYYLTENELLAHITKK